MPALLKIRVPTFLPVGGPSSAISHQPWTAIAVSVQLNCSIKPLLEKLVGNGEASILVQAEGGPQRYEMEER